MLKKSFTVVSIILIAMALFTAPAIAQEQTYEYLKIVELTIGKQNASVNGLEVKMDQPAYAKNGRTLVPFRFLGESIGSDISWDGSKNQATLKLGQTSVKVTIGSKVAEVNGKTINLDVPAESKGGRTFIPLRFVSESLGASVDYDKDTQTVTVKYFDTTGWKELKSPETNEVLHLYPADWQANLINDNTVLHITSPRGSKFWVAYDSELTVLEGIDRAKKSAEKDGYVFDFEVLVDESEPEGGKWLFFTKNDPANPNDSMTLNVLLSKQPNGDTLLIEEEMKVVNELEDDAIFMKIIYG